MRSFLQPHHLRRVALVILICWIVPFLGSFAINIIYDTDHPGQTAKSSVDTSNKDRSEEIAKTGKNISKGNVSQSEPAPIQTPSDNRDHSYSTAGNYQRNSSGNTNPAVSGEQNRRYTEKPVANNQGDLHLLARIIYAEARGEPLTGQVAVGAVLLNRVKDHRFPNNLWGIIFKQGEFCTVRDGQVWLNPDKNAYKAAQLALSGWDPTGGALYFYNPAKTTSKWIWSRPVTTQIGHHIFAR